jgi:hypothetical protein
MLAQILLWLDLQSMVLAIRLKQFAICARLRKTQLLHLGGAN